MLKRFRYSAIKLSLAIFMIFLIQILFYNYGFTDYLLLNKNSFYEPWRFFTSIFLHASFPHLIFNLFALLLFGTILERFVGSNRFLLIFIVSGILANLISVFPYEASLGASGAIFGVIGALIIVRPMLPVWAFGMPMPIFIAGILWAAGDVLGTIGFLIGNPIDNTGNIAHLSGMFFGFLFGIFDRRKLKSMKQVRKNVSLDENEVRMWEDKHLRHTRHY